MSNHLSKYKVRSARRVLFRKEPAKNAAPEKGSKTAPPLAGQSNYTPRYPGRILTYSDLKRLKGITYSRQHLARLENAGKFPVRIQLGAGRIGWLEVEVDEWLRNKAAARWDTTAPETRAEEQGQKAQTATTTPTHAPKKRQPYQFWQPSDSDWPQPCEGVDLSWAGLALNFGNAPILARYLRETEQIDPSLLESITRMLDPDTAGNERLRLRLRYRNRGRPAERKPDLAALRPAELADLLDPPQGRKWQLEFVGQRGSPGKADQFWKDHAIQLNVRIALIQERKVDQAIDAVRRETGSSRATIYRAWKANQR